MRRTWLWAIAALFVIGAARLAIPAAPAMYEGPIGPAEPYHYCTPPAQMTTVNTKPSGGSGDLLPQADASQLGSISTADNQVLTFFPKGALKAPGSAKFHVAITPSCSTPIPPPPAGNQLVGNAYDLNVLGQPGDIAVTFAVPAQVLLRTPPVQYTSVELYYAETWHSTQWGQQGDIANVSVNHGGVLAAFDDGRNNAPGKAPGQQTPTILLITEIVLIAVAVGIVVGAIFVQRRRSAADETAVSPTSGSRKSVRNSRKR